MDKVREAIFAMIRDEIPGSNVLDLYAGSGALGFEAMSEQAESCDFVDNSYNSIKTIHRNAEKLGILNKVRIHKCSAVSYIRDCHEIFDLIFIDPPYRKDLGIKTVKEILQQDLLSSNGIIILETGKNEVLDLDEERIIKQKHYGDTKVTLLH